MPTNYKEQEQEQEQEPFLIQQNHQFPTTPLVPALQIPDIPKLHYTTLL